MMYKLIFADDEKLVRTKISQMVDWGSVGFSLIACCENGYELMEMVERELPDLVILDINMPFISGLEAARQIHRSYPHIRLIFLTGYSEFDYAKQAIELKALSYIVKPVGAQELKSVLVKARDVLDAEHQRIEKVADLELALVENEKILLKDLFTDKALDDSIYDRAKICGHKWTQATQFQVALLCVDKIGRSKKWTGVKEEVLRYALYNVSLEFMRTANLGMVNICGQNVVLLGVSQTGGNLTERMQQTVELILHTVKTQLDFTVTAGISNVCNGCIDIASAAADAKRALELQVKEGGNRMYTMQDLDSCAGVHSAVWNAVNYIETNYTDPMLSVDFICDYLHVSPSYLRALFKKQTGNTIIGYITKARLERACTLLKDKTLKSSTIGEMVGYTDSHYFSYCFKRYYGVTPMAMREKFRTS